MGVRILSIGDELLDGSCVDTNAAWLASSLADRGLSVDSINTVPDIVERIASSLVESASQSSLVIATGGLGPTPDDLSREGLAHAIGEKLVVDDAALSWSRSRLEGRGFQFTSPQAGMARRPGSASWFPNDMGTAPPLHAKIGECDVWLLPGPPAEMKSCFEAHVLPGLPSNEPGERSWVERIRCHGLLEAEIVERLGELLDRDNPVQVGTRMSRGIFIATVHAASREQGEPVAASIEERLRPHVLGRGDVTMSSSVGGLLLEQGVTLATAESCTGGMVGACIVDTQGSSRWYHGGVVCYTNELKQSLLNVPSSLFEPGAPGAVSAEVASAMAQGARSATGADIGLSITGIAGPDGGTQQKPVGTVWISIARGEDVTSRCYRFPGDRQGIRRRALTHALQLLRLVLLGEVESASLPWESTG